MNPLLDLRTAVEEAAAALRPNGAGVEPTLRRSPRAQFGDYSTNAALLLAPALGAPPRELAERLGEALGAWLGDRLERFEVAGPGFVNIFLSDAWYRRALGHVLAAGEGFGGDGAGSSAERVLVEFVSANPTGPLTVASGRHAAYGDALARVLAFHGHEVQREYYVNDTGSQVLRLGESIRARARGEAVGRDGYQGEYVADLAGEIPDAAELEPDALAVRGIELMLTRIRETLGRFRCEFDVWFSERAVHEGDPSAIARAYAELDRRDALYRSEDALWLRTTAHGDDRDRVLERSTGEPTYLAADIAHHGDKRERGFERLIDVFGADHHGHVGGLKAAFAALGGDPDALEVVILQFVHLVKRGERASMSKRRGEFVTLDDLLDEIGVDAARYFLLGRSHDTTLDLDVDLAREQSNENPVYYVQYAHARIASVLANAGGARVESALAAAGLEARADAGDAPLQPAERTLVKKLLELPDEVADAANRRAPHRIAVYALELAQDFTAFYRDCRVVGATPAALEAWRIALSVAAQRTISRGLGLLGVSAPESM